jgi:hypothetical protein
VEVDQTGDENSDTVSPLVTLGRISISESEKAEALADSLETQFQPVTEPSVMVNAEMRSYSMTPASEP